MFERYRHLARLVMLEGDGDNGGGDTPPKPRASELLNQYNGDAVRMAEKLAEVLTDNATLRETRRSLKADVATLTGKQAPEGAVILTGDDATSYAAYQALGKPGDLTKRLADAETATARLGALERDATLRQVADSAGYKLAALKRLGGDLQYVVKDVAGEDGKPVSRAFVKTEQGEKPLAEYAQTEWADFADSLKATGATPTAPTGILYPTTPGGGQAPKSLTDAHIERMNQRAATAPNPLTPQAATA